MKINVDTRDLVKWGAFFEEMPRATKRAVARAMNTFGEGVVNEYARIIADKNGQDPQDVKSKILVHEADARHLDWVMDASLVVAPNVAWNRPWETRDQSAFDQDTLINIITCGDGYVCQLCLDAAAEGPYTMQQIQVLQSKWADYVPPTPNIQPGVVTNLIHPRCRCSVQPWTSYRRLPVSFQPEGAGGNVGSTPPNLMTMKQLAHKLKEEIQIEIHAVKELF